jgi:hypothetical protein
MNRVLKSVVAGAGAAFVVGVVVAAPVSVRSDGIEFPDATVQTTAAAAAVEAHPQHCAHTTGLIPNQTVVLNCFSYRTGDTPWGVSGVPAGFYFVVTDVALEPDNAITETGDIGFNLLQSYNCEDASPSDRLRRRFRVVPNLQTTTWSFRAPTLLLPPGDCLRVTVDAGITVPILVTVTGFLTTNPERLGS